MERSRGKVRLEGNKEEKVELEKRKVVLQTLSVTCHLRKFVFCVK